MSRTAPVATMKLRITLAPPSCRPLVVVVPLALKLSTDVVALARAIRLLVAPVRTFPVGPSPSQLPPFIITLPVMAWTELVVSRVPPWLIVMLREEPRGLALLLALLKRPPLLTTSWPE